MKRIFYALLALLLLASPAAAQLTANSLGQVQMPAQTVLGNSLPTAGPLNAISFAQLSANLLSTSGVVTTGQNGGTGGEVIFNGATTGQANIAVAATGGNLTATTPQFGATGILASGVNGASAGELVLNGLVSGSATLAVNNSGGGVVLSGGSSNLQTLGGLISGSAGGNSGSVTLNGATSGSNSIATNATAGILTATAPAFNVTGTFATGANGGTGGQIALNGSTSGNFSISASSVGVPTMSTPWPVAAGGTGDTGTAWSGFTPNFTCGTATFSATGGQSKTIGKTTFISGTFTVSTLGTCTNQVTFTLPNTAAANGVLPSFNASTNTVGTCSLVGTSPTASCIQAAGANYAATNVINFTGTYTNQ